MEPQLNFDGDLKALDGRALILHLRGPIDEPAVRWTAHDTVDEILFEGVDDSATAEIALRRMAAILREAPL